MKAWEINDISLELDMTNADDMERIENAFETMEKEESAIPKDGRRSEIIRAYCRIFYNLYDRIFGEGTSEKIFRDVPVSITAYNRIYSAFLDFLRSQADENARLEAEWRKKYLPRKTK